MSISSERAFAVGAGALALVVLVPAAALIALWGFDGLYGQDAFAYADYALGDLTDALQDFRPPPAFFWPPGYPLAVALLAMLSGLGDRSGQVVGLLAGAAVPVLTALLALELQPAERPAATRRLVALLGGLVVALTGQLWQSSVVAMSDTAALAAATLGAWAVCRYARTQRAWLLWLAAGALAFATETRLIYGLAAVPLAIIGLIALVRLYQETPSRAAAHAVSAIALAVIVGAPTIVPIVGALGTGGSLPFLGQLDVHVWSPANAFRSSFATADGRLTYELPTGAFYLLQPFQHYWFLALALLAVPGIVVVLRDRAAAQLAVLLGWPLLVAGFMAGDAYQNTRFTLAIAPPVAILIAFGSHATWTWLRRSATPWRSAAGRALIVAVIGGLALNAVLAARFTNAFIQRVTADATAIRSLAARVPPGARVVSLGATPLLEHDARVDVLELAYLDESTILDLVADRRPTFVLVDPAAMSGQWGDREPGRAIEVLADTYGLEEEGSAGDWHLYLVTNL